MVVISQHSIILHAVVLIYCMYVEH